MKPQQITVLGSTGSIGGSTLDVIRRHPERYQVFALCAQRQVDKLFAQCREFMPRYAVLGAPDSAAELASRCRAAGLSTEVLYGEAAQIAISTAPEVDAVMAAIVGAAGLEPTLAAAQAGKKVLLANKEVLVMAGELFMHAVRQHGASLLPVDSEHNAIFQALPADFSAGLSACGVDKILLTASGGPFRATPLADLENVTPEQACAHPNWVMGRKISVDSATMMNKGLEVIEAHWLFAAPPEMIQVVVHPQSVIHSAVQYTDGSVLAQLGNPDMRTRLPMRWRGRSGLLRAWCRLICLPLVAWISIPLIFPVSVACSWPMMCCVREGRPPPFSTQPTKWRWLPFWKDGWAFSISRASTRVCWLPCRRRRKVAWMMCGQPIRQQGAWPRH
ncbi:hypothetical protein MASR1M42_15630 [Azonexus hydrophilus]